MPIHLEDIPALSPNLLAMPYVRQLIEHPEKFKVAVTRPGGVTLVDCGVEAKGGWDAGVLFSNICLGGMAKVHLTWSDFAGLHWPAVEVVTDHPIRACMASQYAGWYIKTESYFAMGSGPARAVAGNEELFEKLGYKDSSKTAVLCLEGSKLPDAETALWLAERCGCLPESLYILIAPTASPAGSVQIAARSVETGLHKLMELGYDLGKIESGWGHAPVPPVAGDDMTALGRTNDAILYGTAVHYTLEDDDEYLKELLPKIPSSSSKDFGEPFKAVFKRYGNFYDIDPLLFSPAKVIITNRKSGRSFSAGEVRKDLLERSFEL